MLHLTPAPRSASRAVRAAPGARQATSRHTAQRTHSHFSTHTHTHVLHPTSQRHFSTHTQHPHNHNNTPAAAGKAPGKPCCPAASIAGYGSIPPCASEAAESEGD
eukprot:694602-Rhodomonas_salina.1